MSEYEYEQPTHDEPTADYPPADQYDSLIGQPIDGGFAEPHEQSVGGFTANDGYGPDVVNYGDQAEGYTGGEQPADAGAGYGEAGTPDYAGAEADPAYTGAEQPTGEYDPNYAGGDQPAGEPTYAGGEQPAGEPTYAADGGEYAQGEPTYAADGGEYAQPTQGTTAQ